MREPLKHLLERTTPIGMLARFQRQRQLKKKYQLWKKEGAIAPMPNFGKQSVVIDYIKKFSPEVFIETGTYKGKMVYAVQPHVKEIYSIELGENHYENARKRFAGHEGIHILHGDSGRILPQILEKIDKPCLFWLDAHWSGGSTAKADVETPIMQEMQCILKHKQANNHTILIDDARCFTGENYYPRLDSLKKFVLGLNPDLIFEIKDDIIRTHSKAFMKSE